MVVMVWHPERKAWVFGEAEGLLFGITGAVIAFNRIPAFIVAIARRWLAIPVQNFFDDFRILDLLGSKGSANRYFLKLCELIGYRVDPKKAQGPSRSAVFLGNVENYTPVENEEVIQLEAKPGRANAIANVIHEAKAIRRLPPGEAKSLRGKMIHYANTCPGRVGKGILYYLNLQALGQSSEFNDGLDFNMDFLLELLALAESRRIPIMRSRVVGPRIWSDASYAVNDQGRAICKICAIIVPALGVQPKGLVTQVPDNVLSLVCSRKQQIHMGELFGPLCAVLKWSHLLRNTSAIFYIDNMGVLCNIVNGASRQLDAGTMTFALHLRLAALQSSCWWEWVQSESNCSDGGSRVGLDCPLAQKLGIRLEEVAFPPLPAHFMKMKPQQWKEFWEISE